MFSVLILCILQDSFFLATLGLCCCVRAFSICGKQRLLFVVVHGLLTVVASLVAEHVGFSSFGTWAQELWLTSSRAQAQELWRTGLVALQHVGSSQTRARTHVPYIGRQILNHCTTREAQDSLLFLAAFPRLLQIRSSYR